MNELKFDFSKISKDSQIVKVVEELGELIQAIKNSSNIEEEYADCVIAMYGLGKILSISYDEAIKNGIEKVNSRIKS